MNKQYLVLARCGMDDIPMSLWDTYLAAKEFAEATTIMDVEKKASDVFEMDVSVFCNMCVVIFEDGEAVRVNLVKDFGKE